VRKSFFCSTPATAAPAFLAFALNMWRLFAIITENQNQLGSCRSSETDMAVLTLRRGRDESLRRRHPWIFSGAVERVLDNPALGDTVDVVSAEGEWLARAAYSPHSQIRARVWTFLQSETVDAGFFAQRLQRAISLRGDIDSTGLRLVFSESDGLPGLIVDRYDRQLVCQFLASGVERWKSAIVAALRQVLPDAVGIYERSDSSVRQKEGLPMHTGVLSGMEPPERIRIREGELDYAVDIRSGHKTGFYLDQRANRALVAAQCRGGAVLNCFSFTGAFGIAALAAGAERVLQVDSSESALNMARENTELNGFELSRCEFIRSDVFQLLRGYRDSGTSFDVVILDPPKFAESQAQLHRAARGYKDINLSAIRLLKPGGWLATFSCSGLLAVELLQKIVADAALDAGRQLQIVQRLFQDRDHPTLASFPEAAYLKGFLCRVLD
jgi:23S rRNA (cytosine1962-C5)-methyltransferase